MKKKITTIILAGALAAVSGAQTILQGPSSSQTSYLQPLVPSSTITSVLTASNVVSGYTMSGLPDGLGAFDNGNGSFTLLMNHEFGNSSGAVHAHGSAGAYVSRWVISKSNLQVQSGTDLIQNVRLWTGSTYTTYNATSPSTLAAFTRFCSGDLPAATAYFNEGSGKGTMERIFMNGEESGTEGRAFAHIVTGSEAGYSYELPYLGKAAWENVVASPFPQDKTIVIGMDDSTPGQVYVYVGNKSSGGNDITKAGLSGGKLYGVAVLGLLNESSSSVPAANTVFNLLDLGSIQNSTGANINTLSNNIGVTNFLRPEDGAWDPSNPRDFYFVTTNAFSSPSRMWRLRFNDILNPEQGGTITAVLNGTEGQKMLDNMGIDHFGHIMLQEDVGGNIHNGKIWQYKISTGQLSLFAQHDTTRFITGGANFLTIDEESSGVIDAQEILGPGMFLTVDQAHYSVPSPVVEGGQLLAFYNPASANANPEINVTGNNISIPSGNTITSSGNFTDYSNINLGTSLTQSFAIRNGGPGLLTVKSLSIGGMNAGDFSIISSPLFPATVAVNGSLTVYFRLSPGQLGIRKAIVYINNNDFDESRYAFAIQGSGVAPELDVLGNNLNITAGQNSVNVNDNTDFGSVFYGNGIQKTFQLTNTGSGTLTISGISLSGTNTSIWNISGMPALPVVLAPSASQSITVDYTPVIPNATNTAVVNISSNDADEANYNFTILGRSMMDVGIAQIGANGQSLLIFPNPSSEEATIRFISNSVGELFLTVSDLAGKAVVQKQMNAEKGVNEIRINTKDLSAGDYIVGLRISGSTMKSKLVVSH